MSKSGFVQGSPGDGLQGNGNRGSNWQAAIPERSEAQKPPWADDADGPGDDPRGVLRPDLEKQ